MEIKKPVVLGLVLPFVLAITACGGSSGGPGGGPIYDTDVPAPGTEEFEGLSPELQALATEFLERNRGTPSDASTLTGPATYSGAVAMALDDNDDDDNPTVLLGEIGLTADFDLDSISGELGNFTAGDVDDPIAVTGELTFSDGVITGSSFKGTDLGGTLFDPEGDNFDFSGTIEGTFLTDGGGQVIGILEGKVTESGGAIDDFDGIFSADKDD